MKISHLIFCVFIALFSVNLTAGEFNIAVLSSDGEPVENAVVTLSSAEKIKITANQTFIIDQIDKTFVPHVKIIPIGSKLNFPNKDDIHHHVYSFSEARKFDLPLYEGTPANPITFNKAGLVVLGCNIHDWMRGYIYISDTPYYGLTDQSGGARIENIPSGKYALRIWHPQIKNSDNSKPVTISISENNSNIHKETLQLTPVIKIRRAPSVKRRNY